MISMIEMISMISMIEMIPMIPMIPCSVRSSCEVFARNSSLSWRRHPGRHVDARVPRANALQPEGDPDDWELAPSDHRAPAQR
ncbi:MAG: hypothetical protein H6713_03555 [Myxococcales bacterium]|nr:hypothetical protein [Myxococcales bacterium]